MSTVTVVGSGQELYEMMKTALRHKVCTVVFTKKNGELRSMECTLHQDVLREYVELKEPVEPRPVNYETLAVWDTNKNDWRSFVVANVISFDGTDVVVEDTE